MPNRIRAMTMNPKGLYTRRLHMISISAFATAIILLALTLFISAHSYVNDDAVISYRYAWRLVRGEGLVTWPGGPHEEGFSNPLLVVLSALGAYLCGNRSLEMVIVSGYISNYAAAAALLCLFCFNPVRSRRPMSMWLAPIFLVMSYPLTWYLHSGLETPLYTFFLTATVFSIAAGRPSLTALASMGLATTRTEGIFLALIAWGAFFIQVLIPPRSQKTGDKTSNGCPDGGGCAKSNRWKILIWCVVFAAVYLLFTIVRMLYFGHFLPTPLLVKSPLIDNGRPLLKGFDYLLKNVQSYPFFPVMVLLGFIEMCHPSRIRRYLPHLAMVVSQIFFIVAVGGDDIHLGAFRFLLPVYPLMIWCASETISRIESRGLASWISVLLIMLTMPYYNTMSQTWNIRNHGFFKRFYENPAKTVTTYWKRWTTPSVWIDAEAGRFMANITADQGYGLSMASVQAGSLPVHWQGEFIDLIGLTTRQMAIAGHTEAKNAVFKADPPDIVMAYRWMEGWFPVPSARIMSELGYRPVLLIQLKETIEIGLSDNDLTITFLVLVRDPKILKNLSSETFQGMVHVTFDDHTGEIANDVLLKIIHINRGITGE
jgi:hypothetical protein